MDNLHSDMDIKAMFVKIIGKLESIESKLDESIYPNEEFFEPDFIERIRAAENEISDGNYVEFESMADLLDSIET